MKLSKYIKEKYILLILPYMLNEFIIDLLTGILSGRKDVKGLNSMLKVGILLFVLISTLVTAFIENRNEFKNVKIFDVIVLLVIWSIAFTVHANSIGINFYLIFSYLLCELTLFLFIKDLDIK